MARPTAVDLFAGAGGMSLGFEQAGFDVVAAVEVDPIHAAVHSFNFPRCEVLCSDVRKLTGAAILERASIKAGKVDLVVGGAPCQGFSLIGHRAFEDPRNELVSHFVRLVHELRADYFVFENVKGLTVGKHKQFLDEIVEAFSDEYEVQLPWKVLNAANFGVPQSRERLFLIGPRKGLRLPSYPTPITRAAGKVASPLNLPEGPSCEAALGDLPDADMFDRLWTVDDVPIKKSEWGKPSTYAKQMRGVVAAEDDFAHPRIWDPARLTSSMRTEHTPISRRRFEDTAGGVVEPISRLFRLPSGGVSNTLRAGTDAARGAFTSPRPIHYKHSRLITVREMARLHSFPDWFRLHATKWHGARQIGNAVPPLLAKAVGGAVIAAMKRKPSKPAKPVELGSPELLQLDMRTAAELLGIPVVIKRRDRKSGARKRTQLEIENSRLAFQSSVGDELTT